MLDIAFKEWAVVCLALAEGRQSIILRKGGISEAGGVFRPEHERFWLYPTYLHEHRAGIKPEAYSLFDKALAERPAAGLVRLSHYAEVMGVEHCSDWPMIEKLDPLHIWSAEAVRKKFDYRQPGLFVLKVRVIPARAPIDITETAALAGCKTWVKLESPVGT